MERLESVLAEQKTTLEEKDAQLATLLSRVSQIEHTLALANKPIIGPKSERMPTPEDEIKAREGNKRRGGYTNPSKRKENDEALASLPTTIVNHPIPEEERRCPHCGEDVRSIGGGGDVSFEYEWIPGRLARRKHVVEVGRCPCKQHYARGPAPQRVQQGCKFGPAFFAKLAVEKCADATPIYRVEKAMRRTGVPISRSSMNDLVLRAADILKPIWHAGFNEIPWRRDSSQGARWAWRCGT